MSFRDDLLRRITKKKAEIADLRREMEMKIAGEERYLQAMLDTYKLLPREGAAEPFSGGGGVTLRQGSMTGKAYEVLKAAGKPLHVNKLLEGMGKKPNRKNASGLASSVRAYANKGEIFTKPFPNTYGLVEWGEEVNRAPAGASLVDLIRFEEPDEPAEET
jgi:hypothetical protein